MIISDFYPELDSFLLSLKGVEKDYQADWGWTRYKIRGKMFCAFCGEGSDFTLITVKCEPDFNDRIRILHEGAIIPGYYMDKRNWSSIYPDRDVPFELICEMCKRGHSLVLASFSKKARQEILGGQ